MAKTPELKEAKAEIRGLNEELEQRVIERTRELTATNVELRREIAERQHAEDELVRQKEILQKIFDHIPVMINFVGADGHIKLLNREWERTLGWSLEEIRQQNLDVFAECYPDPQYRQQVLKFVAEAKGKWADFKTRVRDGRVIDTSFVRIHLSDGTSIGIGKDITERKQAEEALDERLRFETLVTELSAAFANLSPNEVDREIDKWLQSLAEFLGVDRASFFQFGQDWTTLYRSHSYTVPGIEALPQTPIAMKDQFPWITDHLRRGVTVSWSRIPDDMPEEAAKEREYAAKLGVKSGLNIPVLMGGSVICAITFASIVTYRDWPDAMVARLRLVGEIFAAAVERKRAEALLRAKEQEFRAIVENAPDQIIRYDREFRRTYVNPAVTSAYGLPAEALIGKPIGSVIEDAGLDVKADELAKIRQQIATVFETGKSCEFEITWPLPLGRRYYSSRFFPELDRNGSVINVLGIARDITERKQAEDALRRSEDRLRLAIDTIPVMAWSLRPDGIVDFLNQPWMDYAGLSLEQYVEAPTDPIHAEDIPRVIERWLAQMAIGEGYEDEMRLRRADGEYRWFLVRTEPLRDEQGGIVKWYGVSIDIEDRKRAEETLQYSETQLAEAQRLAHVGSWDWDIRRNTVTWSDELYRIFGLQPGEINAAGDALRFIHPEDRDLVVSTVQSAVKNKEPYSFYYRIFRPDGDERIVHSRGHIVSDESGEPIRVFGATQDVTDLKRAEEKLKATSQQLRALSARLQSAREEVATRIAREIHDELGSSLTRLKWDLELMAKEHLPAEGDADVAGLREKIPAMSAIIDHTVDVVRRISAELRPSVLDDLGLAAALRLQTKQFQDRTGIVTDCDCSVENLGLNQQQSTALLRVFEEALTNVMRHAGATKVEVSLKRVNGGLVLTIRDNGRGITEAEMLYPSSLGLLGMRERVNLIGGELNITGTEGKGTMVTVRLPS